MRGDTPQPSGATANKLSLRSATLGVGEGAASIRPHRATRWPSVVEWLTKATDKGDEDAERKVKGSRSRKAPSGA